MGTIFFVYTFIGIIIAVIESIESGNPMSVIIAGIFACLSISIPFCKKIPGLSRVMYREVYYKDTRGGFERFIQGVWGGITLDPEEMASAVMDESGIQLARTKFNNLITIFALLFCVYAIFVKELWEPLLDFGKMTIFWLPQKI